MTQHLRANLWLLGLTLIICSALYPAALWGIGQAVLSNEARGSLVDKDGRPASSDKEAVGSRLIAQPFTADEYFQPRPSAASYNASASGASNWGASNYLLRERVARQVGPLVKYAAGPRKGQLVAPEIERWFQQDTFGGKPGIVAQWAEAHGSLAQNWVKADKLNADYVLAWQEKHPQQVARWINDNPGTPAPKTEDVVVPFFVSHSKTYPGTFPSAVEKKTPDGKTEKRIEPVNDGADIQGIFFEMWRQEHPDAELEPVPADMVMASGSGLDPHITLKNALYQLERVAHAWHKKTNRDRAQVQSEIAGMLRGMAEAPLSGLVGDPLVNVLEINLALRKRYGG
jgi:K+-transporting ATPase ATPase C chain